jgi:homoserine O-succinyltransferase/O-acetyltransferase
MIPFADTAPRLPSRRAGRRLTIGLLNNMPDAALGATERQFGDLLRAAAGEGEIELRLFALPGLARGERARGQMAGRYESAEAMADAGLDGLIVTGNEPRAADLDAEPYWPALTQVIDWTQTAGVATLWSCLAAHAAVLHLDGVRRRRLPAKLSGVFLSHVVSDDALIYGATEPFATPHSRQNGLVQADLTRRGYRILTRSSEAGVDAFTKRGPAPALFLQGHPEYEADSLLREYARDVGRFLRRERPTHPGTPRGYFGAETEAALADLALTALGAPDPALMPLYAEALASAAPARTWRASALALYRNWLHGVGKASAGTRDSEYARRAS